MNHHEFRKSQIVSVIGPTDSSHLGSTGKVAEKFRGQDVYRVILTGGGLIEITSDNLCWCDKECSDETR